MGDLIEYPNNFPKNNYFCCTEDPPCAFCQSCGGEYPIFSGSAETGS